MSRFGTCVAANNILHNLLFKNASIKFNPKKGRKNKTNTHALGYCPYLFGAVVKLLIIFRKSQPNYTLV